MRRTLDLIIASTISAVIAVGLYAFAVGSRVEAAYIPVPSGTIAYFNKTSCPTGWTEFTAARGAYILGRVASGTLATLVGTALTDQENRATGVHAHTNSQAGTTQATTTASQGTHTHTLEARATGGSNTGVARLDGLGQFVGPSPLFTTFWDNAVQGTMTTVSAGAITVTNGAITNGAITVNNSSGVAGTNAPYLQLLVCAKS